jgi:hypothetical protein
MKTRLLLGPQTLLLLTLLRRMLLLRGALLGE